MKKTFLLIGCCIFYTQIFSQWQQSLTLKSTENFAGVSAVTDNIIWAVTYDFTVYKTSDGGATWSRIRPKGFAPNVYVLHLYAMNAATAFLSVNTGLTGVGPGLIYKTNDSGRHWSPVFTHEGNCNIIVGMFNDNNGLMSCNYESFDGSVKSGQSLYHTLDGGDTWMIDTINDPTKDFISSLEIKGKQAAITDYSFFYYSSNFGRTWKKQKLPLENLGYNQLQFEDSSYAITNSTSLIRVYVKRPGNAKWVNLGDPTGIGGLLTGLALDGNECWFGEAFDTFNNYYSSDSAKTFSPLIVDSSAGFQFIVKARRGDDIVGATPFGGGRLWINKRGEAVKKPVNNKPEDIPVMEE